MSDNRMSRRTFLGLAAVSPLAAAGCRDEKPAPKQRTQAEVIADYKAKANENDPLNLFNLLQSGEFIGQDGKPVNLAALKTSIRDNFVTLNFGFAECQDYCPMTNQRLAAVGKANPQVTTIVIAAEPEKDGKDPEREGEEGPRDKFMNRLRKEGIKQEIIILYPTRGGQLSKQATLDLTHRAGSAANTSNHGADLFLFAPGGTRLDKRAGDKPLSGFEKDWGGLVSQGMKK